MNKEEILRIIETSLNSGIYPAAIIEKGKAKNRTEWQDGWNACVMNALFEIEKSLGIFEEKWAATDRLFSAYGDVLKPNINGTWSINLGDTWYYACADRENIPEDKQDEVATLLRDYGYLGLLYWVFLQRGHYPEIERVKKQIQIVEGLIDD